jgi:outer membrane lipoprotein SlyB
MLSRRSATTAAILASISTLALTAQAGMAAAQPYDQGGQDYYRDQGPPADYRDTAPPAGEYAPPPGQADDGSYNARVRDYDRDYAAQYSSWAAQNCVDRRNTNTVAGAVIGGVLGAVIGSNVAGHGERTGGAIVGGALGATAGGVIGNASTDRAGCPPGYVVRSGASEFYYSGGYAGPSYSSPSWYHPWTWSGSQWVYRPYRSWYYDHPNYWRRAQYSQDQGSYDQQSSPDYGRDYNRDYDQRSSPDYGRDYNRDDDRDYGPPNGQYAPAPPGWRYGQSYDDRARQFDRGYGERYSYWASRNCVDRRNNNTVAGAVIGGVLGAVIGSNLAERGSRGTGTVVGGALGAVAGGAIGNASTRNGGCPPGYVVRSGAPAFYYNGAYGNQAYDAGPSWYHPWVWSGGRWMYRPYRQWYYQNPSYWRR